jgi:hypothetical protein
MTDSELYFDDGKIFHCDRTHKLLAGCATLQVGRQEGLNKA